MQDGTFSFNDFVELWDEPDVSRLLSAYKGDISLTIHCAENAGWSEERLQKEFFAYINGEIPDRYNWLTPVYAEREAVAPKPALVAG